MKKVYRVLCEINNGCITEKYDTYVFGFNEDKAKNVTAIYWEGISPNICVHILEVELICEDEFDIIGVERIY